MKYDFRKQQDKQQTNTNDNHSSNNSKLNNDKKTNNNVKINNYIDDYEDKTSQNKHKNNNDIKPPKTNGKLKVEYDDEKDSNEEIEHDNKKKSANNVLIDYGNIIPDVQKIPTYKNDAYTSAQLESIRYFRDLTNNLERDIATLTENERQQSDAEIGDRKAEAKKQREEAEEKIVKEYFDKVGAIKKKFKDENDKTEIFVKDYMEQFIISSSITEDEINDQKVLCIKPMIHNMGTMFDLLGEQKEKYLEQAKNDTYAGTNGNIINILDRLDEEMSRGENFGAVRKQARLFDRHINKDTIDTSIYGVDKLGFFNYILDKLKRFVSIILSPIWNFSYDDSYKLLYEYNKKLLDILGSINGKNFSKISIPKCTALYRKLLELEDNTLFFPVSKEKYLEPVKKFLSDFVMEKGDRNEGSCCLMIETCGFGNFIKSISKKVAGDNETINTLMRRYLFENENSIFHGIECTEKLLKLLKKFDGKDCKDLTEYFDSNFAGKTIKISDKTITIPLVNTKEKDEQYKKYKKQMEGILENIYDGTILTTSKNELVKKKFKTKSAEIDITSSREGYLKLRNFIHTINSIYDDDIDRLNKLDQVYISSVVPRAKKMIEYAKQENISEAKSFGVLTLMKTKIEKMKQDYIDKKEDIENKKKKQIQKNKDEFIKLYKKMKSAIENEKAFKDTLVREHYQAQFKKIEKYIIKKYGKSAIEETEDKKRLKAIEEEIDEYIEENNQASETNTSMYDEAIEDIDKMLKEIEKRPNKKNNKSLKEIDDMFNERAKHSLEAFKNMRGGMMGMRGGGFGGGFNND